MQHNKYLDDLGIPVENYGVNFIEDDDRLPTWQQEQKIYGFDARETWALRDIFIQWVYSRLMMYKEVANINLDCHQINYDGKTYTQREAIDTVLDVCARVLKEELNIYQAIPSIHLFAELLPCLWW